MPSASASTRPAPPRRLAFGDVVLDLAAERLSRGGTAVALAPRYFAVLAHLATSGGRLVEKNELLDAIWGHRHVSDSVLKVAINAVRVALGDDSRAPRHLETVQRRGYRFIATVQVLDDGAAAPEVADPHPPGDAAVTPPPGNLPASPATLIGRGTDLQRLAEALAGHRLVTLHGPGGVGKTRLALAGAGLAAPPDGVWPLRLDSLADAAPLCATIARIAARARSLRPVR